MTPLARFARYVAATIALLLALGYVPPVCATNLTGTFRHPDGSPVDGKLIFLLSQPARLSDASAQIVPRVKIFAIANGTLEAGAFIYGNDALLPSGTHYQVRLVDANNNLLFEQKWYIQGTDMDLSGLTPTTIGVALPDPLLRNETGEQVVVGPVTFNSDLTAYSLTLNGNLHPGSPESYDLGMPSSAWRNLYLKNLHTRGPSPWFDVVAYGAKCDDTTDDSPAYQAALNAAAAAGGGTVYFPSCASKYYLQTAVDLPSNESRLFWIRTLFAGNVRVGAEITVDQPDYIFEGETGGSQTNYSFQFRPSMTFTHDAGVANVFRVVTYNVPSVVRGTPVIFKSIAITLTGTTNGIYFYPGTVNDSANAVWIIEGVAIRTTGTGYCLKIDSAYEGYIQGNFVFDAGPNADYSVYITDTNSATGLLRFKDGVLIGAGIYAVDNPTNVQPAGFGNSSFEHILTESFRTPFLTLNRGAGGNQGGSITFSDLSMADVVSGGGAIVKYIGATGKVSGLFFRQVMPGTSGFIDSTGNCPIGSVVFGGMNAASDFADDLGKTGCSFTFFERDGKVVFGTTGSDGSAHFLGKVGVNLGAVAVGGPVPKAPLDISDGTGYGGTPDATTQLLLQKNDHATLTIGTPNAKLGRIYFARPSFPSNGQILYDHNDDSMLFRVGAANALHLRSTVMDLYKQPHPTMTTGTAPFTIDSTTEVANLNAQLWHGKQAIDFSASLNFGSISAQTCAELTIGSVTGAVTGNAIAAAWPSTLESGLTGIMYVSAVDTVTVRLCNITSSAIDPASQVFSGRLMK